MSRYPDKEGWEAAGSPRIQPLVVPDYKPEYAEIVSRMLSSGLTLSDVYRALGVTKHGFQKWRSEHPELKAACARAKEMVRAELVRTGLEMAKGYTVEDEEVTSRGVMGEDGKPMLVADMPVRVKITRRHVPGNANILRFMLSAIDRQLGSGSWQDQKTVENVERHTIDISAVTKQIDKLASSPTASLPPVIDAKFEEPSDAGE